MDDFAKKDSFNAFLFFVLFITLVVDIDIIMYDSYMQCLHSNEKKHDDAIIIMKQISIKKKIVKISMMRIDKPMTNTQVLIIKLQ